MNMREPNVSVTVIAKHMPGDYDIEYTSPWAGAHFLPMPGGNNMEYERRSWPEISRLASEVPAAGIHFQKSTLLRRDRSLPDENAYKGLWRDEFWYASVLPNFRKLDPATVPAGHDAGIEFTTVCINVALYLPWLASQCLAAGVIVKRGVVGHVLDAKALHASGNPADVVVNATGLSSRSLGGVEDGRLHPARGQTVIVRNETPVNFSLTTTGTDDGVTEVCYIMMRAAGGGTVLGGTYDLDNWDAKPDEAIAERIMRRVVAICPELADGKGVEGLDVIRHAVGLRPYREGGVRIESEMAQRGEEKGWVVHNYGHSGWGFQGSYGCAERVVELVREIRAERAG